MKTPKGPNWHKDQVDRYVGPGANAGAGEQERYRVYADTLKAILKQACVLFSPQAIVEVREKSIASFAEKAIRKAHKYDDSVRQLTDLCGGRVILHTLDEMNAICRFVREQFVIDEANSVDAGSRLKETEFGYRSIHYVVQIQKQEILGVPVPLDTIGNRKAEIQVRTVAQHAWAAITHDRLYKGGFVVPNRLKRLAHRTAALLEEADEALDEFETELQSFLGNYTAYLTPEQLRQEIAIVKMVLAAEAIPENKPGISLRLAGLYRAAGAVTEAIECWRRTHQRAAGCACRFLSSWVGLSSNGTPATMSGAAKRCFERPPDPRSRAS